MKKDSFRVPVSGFGEVLIEPRGKKGTYYLSFNLDGKHVRKTLRTSNKKTAIASAQNVLVSLKGRVENEQAPISFEDGLEYYLKCLEGQRKPKKTIGQMRLRNVAFLEFLRQKRVREFCDIKRFHADEFIVHVRKDRSESTAFGYWRCVKAMMRYLESRDYISRDPLHGVKFSRPSFRHSVFPTLPQLNSILEKVDFRYPLPITALACLGCRVGELIRIRTCDVDLKKGMITFRKPETYTSKTVCRVVPIHPRLLRAIESSCRPNSEWFFCTLPSPRNVKGGKKLKAENLNESFKNAAKLAGLKVGKFEDDGLTLHSLRGFFKSNAILSGVPREVVDYWQGHSTDRSVAMRHYFKVSDEESMRLMRLVPL